MSAPTVDLPVPPAGPLLRALGIVARPTVPAWITDPAVREDIIAGLLDIPDDLGGEAP